MRTTTLLSVALPLLCLCGSAPGQNHAQPEAARGSFLVQQDATSQDAVTLVQDSSSLPPPGLWGMDILLSNGGFGLGAFYRRQITEDLYWSVTFSVSEAKDDREVEYVDPYTGVPYSPGKLNRFLVLPLMGGVHYRLFREEIVETFRPYLNAAVGPTMVYSMPFVEIETVPGQPPVVHEIEYFSSIGKGSPSWTFGAYVGAGALFGSERSNVFGINIRYYFIYLLDGGIPSLYDMNTGAVSATKNDFGGFFITLNVGLGF